MTSDAVMTETTVVRFDNPFTLPGMETPQPPGSFTVESDFEPVHGAHHIGRRLVATYIYLTNDGGSRMFAVAQAALDAALRADKA